MSLPSSAVLKKARIPLLMALAVLAGCAREPDNAADVVYSGGDILTMAGDQPQYVEALAVKDGKISFIGSKAEAEKLAGKDTQQVDLAGATLIPSIVTSLKDEVTLHGFSSLPNCWKESNFKTKEDLIVALNAVKAQRISSGGRVFCTGYDPAIVRLTEIDLAMAFKETSIILVESSLERVLASETAKEIYFRDAYKTLKSGMQSPDGRPVGFQLGQPADFMVLDKNPLKVTAEPWSAIQITQTFIDGKSVPAAAKDLSMLVLLDLNAAAAKEKSVLAKIEEQRATEAAYRAAEATKAAAKKTEVATKKANTETKAKPATALAADKQQAKRSNEKKPLTPKPPAAETPVADEAPKPKEVRFNMTQDGKKMTPEDFEAWMKAQGIRIVPAKPTEPPKTDTKKDGG